MLAKKVVVMFWSFSIPFFGKINIKYKRKISRNKYLGVLTTPHHHKLWHHTWWSCWVTTVILLRVSLKLLHLSEFSFSGVWRRKTSWCFECCNFRGSRVLSLCFHLNHFLIYYEGLAWLYYLLLGKKNRLCYYLLLGC